MSRFYFFLWLIFGMISISGYGQEGKKSSDPLVPFVEGLGKEKSLAEKKATFKNISVKILWILVGFSVGFSLLLMIQGEVKKGLSLVLFSATLFAISLKIIEII